MITKLHVRNFKSLKDTELSLDTLTVLAGPNASGKSNIVAALKFLSESLLFGLPLALQRTGGMWQLRHNVGRVTDQRLPLSMSSSREREPIAFAVEYSGHDEPAGFAFEIMGGHSMGIQVQAEECRVGPHRFKRTGNDLTDFHAPGSEQFGIVVLEKNELAFNDVPSLIPAFAEFRANLRSMESYSGLPVETLRASQRDYHLNATADNLANVLWTLGTETPEELQRIINFMAAVLPGLQDIYVEPVGQYNLIYFHYRFGAQELRTSTESQGTMHLLALLTALFQPQPPNLIILEEPELHVHPGALGVLADAIRVASQRTQVLITTHSPDLISRFDPAVIRVVEKIEGATQVAPLDPVQIEVVRDRLFSLGELMVSEGLKGHFE